MIHVVTKHVFPLTIVMQTDRMQVKIDRVSPLNIITNVKNSVLECRLDAFL